MEKYPFSPDLLKSLQEQILKQKESQPGPYYAAFDADGTLWDSDLGEQFFQYQIDHCGLESLKDVDPWEHYESTKIPNPIGAYLWLAQINKGQSLDQVRAWAKEAVDKSGARCFESQKKLIKWLQDNDIEVFIVTASVQWAVEPAAQLMGVPFENVLGIKTKVVDGIVTEDQDGPITWRQGKADALLEKTNGVKPIFCSGNTLGDISLIDVSVGGKLCIQTQTDNNGPVQKTHKVT